jgi:hypothetical protein
MDEGTIAASNKMGSLPTFPAARISVGSQPEAEMIAQQGGREAEVRCICNIIVLLRESGHLKIRSGRNPVKEQAQRDVEASRGRSKARCQL